MSHSKPVLPQNDNVAHALAGAGGGVLSMALTYPLITLSTRAQVESKRASTTFLAAIHHIVAREGISGLYSGMSSALFGISVTNFVYYYWAPSTLGTLLSLLRTEGPQALFAGVVPALVLVINPILQYTLFEQMKNGVERRKMRVTPTVAFFLGAVGKLFATSITYPYITVKSQMHVAGAADKKEGVMEAIRRVVREEGYAGLYKGIGPKVTQSVLTAALLFAFKDVLYEHSVRLRGSMARKAIAA
ncbi:hypothetical protein N0V88_000026 [Collariella sp. IMI 366227]|nr:hypothetical protein N0V88_000026 [Collariella sp. IMI 366227]